MAIRKKRAARAGTRRGPEKHVDASENTPLADKSKAGRRSRRKGVRVEQEIVNLHRQFGIKAERVPLSGAGRYKGGGHDIDIYAYGADANPIQAEVKARKDGSGFATLARWLGTNDCLILKANGERPLFVVDERTWFLLLDRSSRG
jgi:hypothetical protein